MFRNSDLHERLSDFHIAQASLQETASKGGFEGVPQAVIEYAFAAEPVGVNGAGHIVLPRSYEPEQGPPVLMFRPGEENRIFGITATRRMARMAQRVIGLSGTDVTVRPKDLHTSIKKSGADAMISYTILDVPPDGDDVDYPVIVPNCVLLRSGMEREILGQVMIHEADHWDFSLHKAPLHQYKANGKLDGFTIKALAEKRAYRVSFDVARNLGLYGGLDTVESLSESYEGLTPTDADEIYTDLVCRRKALGHPNTRFTKAVAAVVVDKLFSKPGEDITVDETNAMCALGIV